jgi:hypothetical protein
MTDNPRNPDLPDMPDPDEEECFICGEPITEVDGEWFHTNGDQEDHEAQVEDA